MELSQSVRKIIKAEKKELWVIEYRVVIFLDESSILIEGFTNANVTIFDIWLFFKGKVSDTPVESQYIFDKIINNMKCIEIRITGRVQGVWFRKYTKEHADRSGVVGSVQNNTDGTVRCIAQGNDDKISEFLNFCHKGSPLSKVEVVEVTEHMMIDSGSFNILR